MNKTKFILTILSLLKNYTFSTLQIQKLFFLLEKRLGTSLFEFKPYSYGPYSFELQNYIDTMVEDNQIRIKNIDRINHYKINENDILEIESFFDEPKRQFVIKLANFVKNLTFKELSMSIYKEFPEMAVNSVFFSKI